MNLYAPVIKSSPANLAHELRHIAKSWEERADNLWYIQEGYKVCQ